MLDLLARSSANLHVKHVLQALHDLDQSSADVRLLEQEDVIGTVVETFSAVSGCLEDSWVVGVYFFGKSWLPIWVKGLGTKTSQMISGGAQD